MEPTPGQPNSSEGDALCCPPHYGPVAPVLQVRPFWILVAGWSVLSGALASGLMSWKRATLLSLSVAFLLVVVAWLGLFWLSTGSDWVAMLRAGCGRSSMALPALPYTRPRSPAGWLGHRMGRLAGWWKQTFWPLAGPTWVMALLVLSLAVVLSSLLPPRIGWLNLVLVIVVALGVAERRRGSDPLAALPYVTIGLPWLAGYLSFARFRWPALLFGMLFSLSAWGVLRLARRLPGGQWLLLGGQFSAACTLVAVGRPMAGAVVMVLALGQALSCLALRFGDDPRSAARRTWPWLLAAMLATSLPIS